MHGVRRLQAADAGVSLSHPLRKAINIITHRDYLHCHHVGGGFFCSAMLAKLDCLFNLLAAKNAIVQKV